jgi:acyl-CoA dehydrogenase
VAGAYFAKDMIMPDYSYLDWPFFEDRHRDLASALEAWCDTNLPVDHGDTDAACRKLVVQLAEGGWLRHTGAEEGERLDVRTLCLVRETLARHDALADFAFAMQALGMGAVSLFGTSVQRQWLHRTRSGTAIAAFALTEPGSGSDVASTATKAQRVQGGYLLDGEKVFISNGGIADVYVIFARTGEAPGAKGLSAFLLPADTPGLEIAERIEVMSPHPLARLRLRGVSLSADALIGQPGDGFKIAMSVLDIVRAPVGAAALGFARRAFDEALVQVRERPADGASSGDLQLLQGHVADMAVDIDAAALLVYRAAWAKDQGKARITREASMAKLFATEASGRVVDLALQLHGHEGGRRGSVVERLYREVRALRIYDGASDVQRVIIARNQLAEVADVLVGANTEIAVR